MHVARANQGEKLKVVTDTVTLKASGADTSGKLLVMEVVVPPGGGPPALHRHTSAEAFYVLEGEFELSTVVDGHLSTVVVGTGDTVSIPSMEWHNFKNVGSATGKVLGIHSPAGLEEFAREIGTPIEDISKSTETCDPPSEAERERIMSAITKYMDVMPLDAIRAESAPLASIVPDC
jgi:mannose-6-phosphate isomerase-like protein (cupin superfamily)